MTIPSSHTLTTAAIFAVPVVVLVAVALGIVLHRRPRKIKVDRFQKHWQTLQKSCSKKEGWPQAIIAADKLLDDALKRRRVGGRNMGERLVQAQRLLTDNDAVWFAHKLRNKIEGNPGMKLKETEVKEALVGLRQALKDLGALPK